VYRCGMGLQKGHAHSMEHTENLEPETARQTATHLSASLAKFTSSQLPTVRCTEALRVMPGPSCSCRCRKRSESTKQGAGGPPACRRHRTERLHEVVMPGRSASQRQHQGPPQDHCCSSMSVCIFVCWVSQAVAEGACCVRMWGRLQAAVLCSMCPQGSPAWCTTGPCPGLARFRRCRW
jgi:hypothetical protein